MPATPLAARENGNGNGNGSSTRAVVRQLVDLIRSEGLSTGDRLAPIRELAGRFGVGANVVRDGLLQAQAMGLVQIQPRAGVFVQTVDYSPLVDALQETLQTTLFLEDPNLFHLNEARRLIEMETSAKAALRCRVEDLLPLSQHMRAMDESGDDLAQLIEADEKFHLGIATIAGNQVYVTILRGLLVLLRPLREVAVPTPETRARTRAQHQQIYRALKEGDPIAASEAMGRHLEGQYNLLIDQVEQAAAEDQPAAPAGRR